MTCPDCGRRVIEATGSLSRRPQRYTPRRGGNLGLDSDGVMVAVDRTPGHPYAPLVDARRYVLHALVCSAPSPAASNWRERDQDAAEVLA